VRPLRGQTPSSTCDDSAVSTPQSGIFALGTASHAYLEFDIAATGRELVTAVSSLREPRTTMGGVNLVAGFRPELWREAVPGEAPSQLAGFNEELVGADGYTMPATQHDAVLWLSGAAYDVVFDVARMAIQSLAGVAAIAEETSSSTTSRRTRTSQAPTRTGSGRSSAATCRTAR